MLSSYELRVVNCFQICIFVLGNTTFPTQVHDEYVL